MDITPVIAANKQVIQNYGPGGFRISGVVYRTPVIVLPELVLEWAVTAPEALTVSDFAPLCADENRPEVVLLGCGARGFLLSLRLRGELKAMGLAIDTMDTGAACRTYNVMLSEERRVAVALILG